MLSLIIPTYNERDNIVPLFKRLEGVFCDWPEPPEVIIVDDDSPDRTWEAALFYRGGLKPKVIRRTENRGLSSAILDGISMASGDRVLVMDADLSHPPELIPAMEKKAQNHLIVIASRYMTRGGTVNWSVSRRFASLLGSVIAGVPTGASDPLSGFFIVHKRILKGMKIRSMGFKALFEILIYARGENLSEVPYVFRPRTRGESKMGLSIMFAFILQAALAYLSTALDVWERMSRD